MTRTVCRKAFLDFKKTQNVEKTGGTEVNSFLLVLPTDHKLVHVGDKVMMGEGPEISDRDWAGFIPAKVEGLVVVRYEDPKYYGTTMVHQEAGG